MSDDLPSEDELETASNVKSAPGIIGIISQEAIVYQVTRDVAKEVRDDLDSELLVDAITRALENDIEATHEYAREERYGEEPEQPEQEQMDERPEEGAAGAPLPSETARGQHKQRVQNAEAKARRSRGRGGGRRF